MNSSIRSSSHLPLTYLFFAIFSIVTSCNESTPTSPAPEFTVMDVIRDSSQLYLTETYIKLGPILENALDRKSETWTFFAPSNEAWVDFQKNFGVPDSITKLNNVFMLDLLGYHAISGFEYDQSDLTGDLNSLWTKDKYPDDPLTFSNGASIGLNGSSVQIIDEPIKANNGTLYIIDRVLIPPSLRNMTRTNAESICINYEIEFFYKAIRNADFHGMTINDQSILSILSGDTPNTIFVSSDTVFRDKGISSDGVNSYYTQEQWYHLIQNRMILSSIDIPSIENHQSFETRSGNTLSIYIDPLDVTGVFLDWNGDFDLSNPDITKLDAALTSPNAVENRNGNIYFVDDI